MYLMNAIRLMYVDVMYVGHLHSVEQGAGHRGQAEGCDGGREVHHPAAFGRSRRVENC